jgi:hypothetical protein
MGKKLISSREAMPAKAQHTKPCSDCPWRRDALAGWLGNASPDEWLADAHSEAVIECHVFTGAQCAGAAVYRANVCKTPRDKTLLRLARDPETVFATPDEFRKCHNELPIRRK